MHYASKRTGFSLSLPDDWTCEGEYETTVAPVIATFRSGALRLALTVRAQAASDPLRRAAAMQQALEARGATAIAPTAMPLFGDADNLVALAFELPPGHCQYWLSASQRDVEFSVTHTGTCQEIMPALTMLAATFRGPSPDMSRAFLDRHARGPLDDLADRAAMSRPERLAAYFHDPSLSTRATRPGWWASLRRRFGSPAA